MPGAEAEQAGSSQPIARRRITFVEFAPSGGLFQFAWQLGDGVSRAGDEVELISGPTPELISSAAGLRVRSILPTWHPTAGADAPRWWRKGRRAVRAGQLLVAWLVLIAYLVLRRPDVVVWSAWRFSIDGWGVRVVRRLLPRAILVLIAHEARPLADQPGDRDIYKPMGLMGRVFKSAYGALDVVYVLGTSSAKILAETWPISAPIRVIPHGDERIYVVGHIPGADETRALALSFGTITSYKGVDTLCGAWPKVRSQVSDAELVIAGAVSADVDQASLRRTVAALEGVRLDVGYVAVGDVTDYFAEARCVVLPYKRSSQSGVAHLAHTMRRPVVATAVGDIPSVVLDDVSGLIVSPDDPDELASSIVRLLQDPALARRMGDAGEAALMDGASWDHVAELFRRGLPAHRER